MSHRRYKIEVHAIRFVFYANSLLLLLLFYIMKLTIAEILDSFICHIYGVYCCIQGFPCHFFPGVSVCEHECMNVDA